MIITYNDLTDCTSSISLVMEKLEEEIKQLEAQARYLKTLDNNLVNAIQYGHVTTLEQVQTAILLGHAYQDVMTVPEIIRSVT